MVINFYHHVLYTNDPYGLRAVVAFVLLEAEAPPPKAEAPPPKAKCCCRASITLGAVEEVKMDEVGELLAEAADWLACC